MQIFSFTVGPFAENTYLLIHQHEALLVDPGFSNSEEMQLFKEKLQSQKAELKAIVLTHAHVDHVLGIHRVLHYQSVPVYLNDNDRYLWNNFASQARMFGLEAESFGFDPESLPAKKNWQIGGFDFDVLFTPGHAPDHVSLYSAKDKFVIAGDALFKQGIGRTDLYKGSFEILEKSIQEKLYMLPDDTVVYPGHGSATTIGDEKSSNPFVQL